MTASTPDPGLPSTFQMDIAVVSATPLGHYRTEMFEHLRSLGLSVTYYAPDTANDDVAPKGLDPKAAVSWVRTSVLERSGWYWQRRVISRVLRAGHDVCVVNGHPRHISTWLIVLLSACLRRPLMIWTIGWMDDKSRLRSALKARIYRLATGLILYGDYARDRAVSYGIEPNRLHVIYNSVTAPPHPALLNRRDEWRQSVRSELGLADDAYVVIYSGRLLARKNVSALVEALALVKRARPVSAIVVGEGPDRERLESMASRLGVEVHFLGPLYDSSELARCYFASDLAVVPGNPGLSVIQPLVFGVPVVYCKQARVYPEAAAVVPGVSGLIAESSSPSALAESIAEASRILVGSEVRSACSAIAAERYVPLQQAKRFAAAVSWARAEV